MKVIILIGSGDESSHSLGLGQAISEQLTKMSAEVELINLVEYGLPLYNRTVERSQAQDEKTKTFLRKSYSTDVFVWVTPIYHNSFSSILKNALDWQHTKFPGKIVGMASNGGSRSPQAVDQLMLVARAQHMITARTRVSTTESDYDDSKKLSNQDILERVKDFVDELIDLADKHKV